MDWPGPLKDREKRIALFVKMAFATLPVSAIGMLIHPVVGLIVFTFLSLPLWLYMIWGLCSVAAIAGTLEFSVSLGVISFFMLPFFGFVAISGFVLLAVIARLIGERLPEFGSW